jgi:hypothetical protein
LRSGDGTSPTATVVPALTGLGFALVDIGKKRLFLQSGPAGVPFAMVLQELALTDLEWDLHPSFHRITKNLLAFDTNPTIGALHE